MDKRFRRLLSISLFLFFLAAVLVGSSFGPGTWLITSSAQQKKEPAIPPAKKGGKRRDSRSQEVFSTAGGRNGLDGEKSGRLRRNLGP
jgi:hypothetical protein